MPQSDIRASNSKPNLKRQFVLREKYNGPSSCNSLSASRNAPGDIGRDGPQLQKPAIPSLGRALRTDASFAGTRRLRAKFEEAGRFIVKCLVDSAMDSTMIGFWP
jgi:hypothetical protein